MRLLSLSLLFFLVFISGCDGSVRSPKYNIRVYEDNEGYRLAPDQLDKQIDYLSGAAYAQGLTTDPAVISDFFAAETVFALSMREPGDCPWGGLPKPYKVMGCVVGTSIAIVRPQYYDGQISRTDCIGLTAFKHELVHIFLEGVKDKHRLTALGTSYPQDPLEYGDIAHKSDAWWGFIERLEVQDLRACAEQDQVVAITSEVANPPMPNIPSSAL